MVKTDTPAQDIFRCMTSQSISARNTVLAINIITCRTYFRHHIGCKWRLNQSITDTSLEFSMTQMNSETVALCTWRALGFAPLFLSWTLSCFHHHALSRHNWPNTVGPAKSQQPNIKTNSKISWSLNYHDQPDSSFSYFFKTKKQMEFRCACMGILIKPAALNTLRKRSSLPSQFFSKKPNGWIYYISIFFIQLDRVRIEKVW